MSQIINNADPKKNPVTTLLGCVFVSISAAMYGIKYILPAFMEFKQELPYEWHTPVWPLLIGILLIFINDSYFNRMFNRAEKVVSKKTDTEP
jgi:hypothetical protein